MRYSSYDIQVPLTVGFSGTNEVEKVLGIKVQNTANGFVLCSSIY